MTDSQTEHIVKVHTGNFAGPISYLLELIEARKLFINEIALAEVAEEYIQHIRSRGNLQLGETTQFIAIAATLVLIKSRSLLPNLSLTEDEESKIVDLEHRLRLYKIIRDATIPFCSTFGSSMLFFGPSHDDTFTVFSPDLSLSTQLLSDALLQVLQEVPTPVSHPDVQIVSVISIDEMIENLEERIHRAVEIKFSDFSHSKIGTTKEQKIFVIVSFLAMLELVREGIIEVMQNSTFSDIEMKKGTPHTYSSKEESEFLLLPNE